MMHVKKSLLLIFFIISPFTPVKALTTSKNPSFLTHVWNSAKEPSVYAPIFTAAFISITDLDGKITEYASKERPLYGSVQGAKNYSDAVAFYALPLAAGITHFLYLKDNPNTHNNMALNGATFLLPSLASYFVNDLIKDKTGRLRPDSSNLESFPSSHTSIASGFGGIINHHSKAVAGDHSAYLIGTSELLVASVAWARLEARKHHLTDTLVGYSVGKFFAHLFYNIMFSPGEYLSSQAFINHKKFSYSLTYSF